MPDNANIDRFRNFLKEAKQKKRDIPPHEWQGFLDDLGIDVVTKLMVEELMNEEDVLRDMTLGGQEMILALGDQQRRLNDDLKPANPEFVNKLLIAHLRLEHLIDQILLGNFKVCDDENLLAQAKLSFWNKVKLLPSKQGIYPQIIPFLLEINRLRNCFVHNLKYDLNDFKSEIFSDFFKREKISGVDQKMEAILKYITNIEWIMVSQTPSYQMKMEEIERKFPRLALVLHELSKKIKK